MAGKNILVIDPDAASRSFLASTLRQHQHTVLQVASGGEGLIGAWRDRPDLVIIEPLLPDLNGPQLAAKLRQDPRTSHLPLVAFSRDNKPESRSACLEAGFQEYIVKSAEALPLLIEAIDQVYVDLHLAERVAMSRQSARRAVLPEVQEPAHFRRVEEILQAGRGAEFGRELAALLTRYGY